MAAEKGRQQYLGVKTEGSRLTAETSSFTRWVPWTALESRNEIAYESDNSAYGNRGALLGKEVASKHGVWSISSKLDVDVVDFFLHHVFGSSAITTANSCSTWVYSLLQSLQLPTFTMQFERGDDGAKKQHGCSPATIELNFGVDDSNFVVSGHSLEESDGNALTSAYTKPARKLMGKHVTMYHATTLAGLGSVSSPTGTTFKVRTAKATINTGVDATRYFELGSTTPTDITADGFGITLELELIHSTANEADHFQDDFDAGTERAFRLHAVGSNYANIGTSSNKPTLSLALPPSKFQLSNAIPLDDLITQTMTVEVEMPSLAVMTLIGSNAAV